MFNLVKCVLKIKYVYTGSCVIQGLDFDSYFVYTYKQSEDDKHIHLWGAHDENISYDYGAYHCSVFFSV